MINEIVYGNEFYEVYGNADNNGYLIRNKVTKVVEGGSEVLPSAVSKADVWNELLQEIVAKLKEEQGEDEGNH